MEPVKRVAPVVLKRNPPKRIHFSPKKFYKEYDSPYNKNKLKKSSLLPYMFDPFKQLQPKEEAVLNEGHHSGHNHAKLSGHHHHHPLEKIDESADGQMQDFLPKIKSALGHKKS